MKPFELAIPQKMADVLASDKRYKCAYGGRGSGKSWSFGAYCLAAGQRKPMRIACMRETMASIRDSSHSLLSQWIDSVPAFGAFWSVEKAVIKGANGSEIIFKGLKEEGAHRIKSLEGVDICWVDEAQAVSSRSWEMLLPTIRKPGSQFLIGWNPYLATDPVWVELIEKRHELVSSVKINYMDNPWLSEEVKREADIAKRDDPDGYRHIWLGEPVSETSSQFIAGETIAAAQQRTTSPSGDLIFGLDLARFGDDSSVLVARQGGAVVWYKAWRKMTPLDVAEQVAPLVIQHGPLAVVIDSVGLGTGAVDPLKRMVGAATQIVLEWPYHATVLEL